MAWINLLERIYPVGSVYISTLQTSPSSVIGGTWTQVTDAVLRGSDSTGYTGSDTHTLSVDEMPAHRHNIQQTYNVGSGVGATVPAWNSNYYNTQYTDYTSFDTEISLPKGSIKKLIGRDLKWEDEPVELK